MRICGRVASAVVVTRQPNRRKDGDVFKVAFRVSDADGTYQVYFWNETGSVPLTKGAQISAVVTKARKDELLVKLDPVDKPIPKILIVKEALSE